MTVHYITDHKVSLSAAADNVRFIPTTSASSDPSIKNSPEEFSSRAEMPFDKLYPESQSLAPHFALAVTLLDQAWGHTNQALEAHGLDDKITQDDQLMLLRALMPELFCCRAVGDGFGTLISVLFYALDHNKETMLNEDQLVNVRYVLKCLKSEPMISFERALDLVEQLEAVQLKTDSKDFEYLAEILGG